MNRPSRIDGRLFYGTYHGHPVHQLDILHARMRSSSTQEGGGLIWTAGDSSLDNKYWFSDTRPAIPGPYADLLDPARSKCDVTYWINRLLHERSKKSDTSNDNIQTSISGAINAAVEATTLNERSRMLTQQDRFIRENLQPEDVLIVSIGGNDIALCPTPCTILSMAGLLCLPYTIIENGCTACSVPINDCCCGCGASTISCLGACPPCLGYFRHLFGTRVEKYIQSLTAKTKPKKVLVCMIYYLDEEDTPSWAGASLAALGYNSNPAKLQMMIRKVFREATCNLKIPGVQIVPVPLFHVLDGKCSEDYVARVEPSAQGGRKMAQFLLDIVNEQQSYTDPPGQSQMYDRMMA